MAVTFTKDLGMTDLYKHVKFCGCRSNGLPVRVPTFSMVLNNVFDLVTPSLDL